MLRWLVNTCTLRSIHPQICYITAARDILIHHTHTLDLLVEVVYAVHNSGHVTTIDYTSKTDRVSRKESMPNTQEIYSHTSIADFERHIGQKTFSSYCRALQEGTK